ncbi:MAG: 16S rRNA (cytidine(1402)-2'-O)-methyltransferase [Verrucomicrobiae bacterium]|nr:16S rRNA (cytidine(1402)-2'-O)-methyltransferase [Verrucomicrobiae bacterium]
MPTGTLYVVATPIGNLEDITLRALRILKEVDFIAAEDTRHTLHLLRRHQIEKPLISYHQWNEAKRTAEFLDKLHAGQSIALVSDAGTPGISDPGARVIQACIEVGVSVVPVPGASALITALVASGLNTDEFRFIGFAPNKSSQRQRLLQSLASEVCTVVIYESPFRIMKFLEDARAILGERRMVVARELTKKFEEILRGTPGEILKKLEGRSIKGEFTVIIADNKKPTADSGYVADR